MLKRTPRTRTPRAAKVSEETRDTQALPLDHENNDTAATDTAATDTATSDTPVNETIVATEERPAPTAATSPSDSVGDQNPNGAPSPETAEPASQTVSSMQNPDQTQDQSPATPDQGAATYIAQNGASEHGMIANGMTENGTSENGTSENGTSENGTSENGTSEHGMTEHVSAASDQSGGTESGENSFGETSSRETVVNGSGMDATRASEVAERAADGTERTADGTERPLESRSLRFRGREGRAEVRARGEERGFRQRSDGTRVEGRTDARGDVPRTDARRGDGDANGGRLMPRPYGRDGNGRGADANGRSADGRGSDGRAADARGAEGRDPAREGAWRDGDGERGGDRIVRVRNDLDLTTLEEMNLPELRDLARELNIAASASLKKSDLVFRILEAQAETSGNLFKRGILQILPDGKGFLRTEGYLPGDEDVYVSQSQIKRFNLRTGDMVSGQVRAPKDMERYFGLLRVEAINGESPEVMRLRKEFEKLTPIFPTEKFKLETTQDNITARIIDLVSPIGKGQRGLIVAPPKAGKTTLIKNIANSIALNHPEVVLIVLLIDERPEEVTDISRSVKGEVVASTFDEMPENHMQVADMVLEKAKRLVEQKRDVVILMDSITRLSRASNLVVTPSGRTLSGGLDPAAMYRPKRMFGAARNIEEGGSLTILATTLVDTGSRMDDMIFEEFKGTGNLDLVLDRSLFDQRIFPAIDINKSGTRRDDLLLSKEDLAAVFHLRRTLAALDNDKAVTLLIDRLKNTKTNHDFMQIVQRSSRQTGS